MSAGRMPSLARRAAARVAAHLRAHAEWYWAPLLYAAVVVYLYRDMFFGPRDVGFGWDTIEHYWGDLAYLAGAIRDREAPLWNPYDYGGSPAVPSRAYYPIDWLLGSYGAVVGHVSWWVIQIKALAHHVLAGAFMHLFLRRRGLPGVAAAVGGCAWIASAPMLIHKASEILWPMTWTPLGWLAVDALTERPGWRTGCALAAVIVTAGAVGSPPGFFYTLLMIAVYGGYRVAVRLFDARPGTTDRRTFVATWRSLAVAVAVAGAVSVLMLLVVIVPTQALTELSHRAQRTVGYALSVPLPWPGTLAGMASPALGTNQPYMGVLVMMLAFSGLMLRPTRDRGAPIAFAVAAAFFMALALGGQTPVLEWLVRHVPGFGLFRVANRYKLLAAPMIAALAAYGAASLIEAAKQWSRQRITALAVAATVTLVMIVLVRTVPPAMEVDRLVRALASRSVWLAGAAALLVAAVVLLPKPAAVVAAWLMLGVIAHDPQSFVHARSPVMEPRMDHLEDRAWLAGLADVTTRFRVHDEFVMEQRPGSRLGIREFRGYPAGMPLEYRRYKDVLERAKTNPELLAAFNIRYVLHGNHHRLGTRANYVKQPPDRTAPDQFVRLRPRVFEARYPAPLAAWYGAIGQARGQRAVLDAVLASLDGDGVRRTVIIEPDMVRRLASHASSEQVQALTGPASKEPGAPPPPDPVTADVVAYQRNRVALRVDAPAAGIVVLNDAYDPGWKVTVDGKPAPGVAVNWLVRGVMVEPGRHDIVWTYQPAHHALLSTLWSIGFFILLAALLVSRFRAPAAR